MNHRCKNKPLLKYKVHKDVVTTLRTLRKIFAFPAVNFLNSLPFPPESNVLNLHAIAPYILVISF